jgi:nucleoside-diphosphate-sugar epimerase
MVRAIATKKRMRRSASPARTEPVPTAAAAAPVHCLVFGASGAIGRFLLPRLHAAGDQVTAVSRRERGGAVQGARWITGDLDGVLALHGIAPPQVLYSLGPLDAFARWLGRMPPGWQPRVVAVGSMSIDSKRDSPDAAERDVAARLARAEHALAETAAVRGCAWTVLRPTLVYGAGVDRSLTPLVRLAHRWHVFPQLAGADGLRQPVHAADLAKACLAVAGEPASAGRAYATGGGERLAFGDMLARVRASLPWHALSIPLPLAALHAGAVLARAAGRPALVGAVARLRQDLVADNAPAQRDFGWSPRAFHPTAADWGAATGDDPGLP